MKTTTRLHLLFLGSCLLAGGGAALAASTEHYILRALGAYNMVFNGLYAIQWAMMQVRASASAEAE